MSIRLDLEIFQGDLVELPVPLSKDLTGKTVYYMVKKTQDQPDSMAIVNTYSRSGGSATLTNEATGLCTIQINGSATKSVTGMHYHELVSVGTSGAVTEMSGTINIKARLFLGAPDLVYPEGDA